MIPLRFFCVLIVCVSLLVVCDATEKEGLHIHSAQCVDIDVQVQKLGEDIRMDTGETSDYLMSYEVFTPKEAPTSDQQPCKQAPSRHSIGLHFSSLKLRLTLNVHVECGTEHGTGLDEHGKLLTGKDGIEISLEYKSSIPSSNGATKRMKTLLYWITWPFTSFRTRTVDLYYFLVDKTTKGFHRITWSLKSLKNKLAASVYSYVKPKIDNPIIVIEWVLEMIWIPVKPVLQAGRWLCVFMVTVKRQVKVKTALFLEKYPVVLDCVVMCQVIRDHVSTVIALWPCDWKDSIEYVGFSWVIVYFMYNLVKFSMMDERKLQRMARNQDGKVNVK